MRRNFCKPFLLVAFFFLLAFGMPAHAAVQTITFGAQGGQTFGVTPFALNPVATASSGLAVSYSSSTLAVCTISGITVTIVAAGTCIIAADQAGDVTYSAAPQVTQNIVVAKAGQTITFGVQTGQAFGAAPFSLNPAASTTSGLVVSYTSTTLPVCTIAGTTVTIVSAGTCTIAANQAGDSNYNPASQVTQNIAIGLASQTITFGAQGGQTFGTAPFALNPVATASSGLAVTYSSTTPSICTMSGITVTLVATGTCTIAANQAGNGSYTAAAQVTQNIVIVKGSQTITFGAQIGQSFGSIPFPLSPAATASSGLAVSYTSQTLSVCTIAGTNVTAITTGTCTIAADQVGNSNYNAAPQVTQSISIGKGNQTITFGAQTGQPLGATPFALNPVASASSALPVSYTSATLSVCTISGTSVTALAPGTCIIAADQAGNANYNAATQVTQNIAIGKANQTITFGVQTGQGFNVASFALSPVATASSGLAVSYSSTTLTICTVSGITVTVVAVGTCTIAANQAGNSSYNAAPQVTQNIVIGKASQTITFGAQTAQTLGAAPFALSPVATASSGLAVSYSSTTTTICTISGITVTIVLAGTCTIAAAQAGNASYNAAPQVTQNIVIGKGSQTITFGAQASKNLGAAPFLLNPLATASSGLTVSYSSTTAPVCTIAGSTVTIVSGGTCIIAADQAGNSSYSAALQVTQSIAIGKGDQTIAFGAQTAKTFGAAPFALNPVAVASSALPVGYTSATLTVCTIAGTTVTLIAAGTCTIAADQTGNANYNAAPQVTQSIAVAKGNQTLTFGAQTGKTFGVAPFALNPVATASSALAVSYSSTTPLVCTISGTTVTLVAAGTCTIAADQTGNANYSAAPQVTQNITIAKGIQTITFGAQGGQIIGVAPFVLSPLATATSGLEVSYASTTLTVCTISGITVTALAIGTCTIAATQAGSANYTAATQVTQSIIVSKASVPSSPIISTVTPGYSSATVNFAAPASNGGSVITGYTATCSATGQTTHTATGAGSPLVVQGLTANVTYSCAVAASNSSGVGASSVPFSVVPASAYEIPVTSSPLTGLWWNERESGWGISINQHGAMIFAAWFTYDQAGQPVWYVMSSCPVLGNACTGDIYQVTGGKSFVVPWDGAGKAATKVGVGILAFSNVNTGVFSFSINGVAGSKSMTRQVFASGSTAPAIDYSDLWWNAAESGWGVTLAHEYDVIFVVMFGYDSGGNPIWYVASNCRFSDNGCSGELYQVTGGSVPAVTWNGANLVVTKVGIIDFIFTGSNSGTMHYFINGEAASKAITRQSF